jgi:hypothetical protein
MLNFIDSVSNFHLYFRCPSTLFLLVESSSREAQDSVSLGAAGVVDLLKKHKADPSKIISLSKNLCDLIIASQGDLKSC